MRKKNIRVLCLDNGQSEPAGITGVKKKSKPWAGRHFKKCKCLKRWAYQPITRGEATTYNYTKQGVCHIVASPFTLKSI
jgi:hypothetical protein